MEIGDSLRRSRKAAGIKQIELARMLGLTPTYVCDLEKGRKPFLPKHLSALPPLMRRDVAAAMIAQFEREIAELCQVA
jgi:transcriptional regulator with XRE-family HTH domain